MGPVPMQNALIFSQFEQKNSQSENKFLVVFNNYSIFFRLGVLSFNLKSNNMKLYDMTTYNSRHSLQKIRNIFI